MPANQENTPNTQLIQEPLRHSVVFLMLFDLVTLGLYSVARSILVHAEISKRTGRRPFAPAFLHVLIVLNLLLVIFRFSRNNAPWDGTVMMARFGAGLLGMTLLLIFRRSLQNDFSLRIRPLPLALFGFWYLQYKINRGQEHPAIKRDHWSVPVGVLILSLTILMALGMLKHARVSDSSMEPTLVAGDHVLVDPISYQLTQPKRGEVLVFQSPENERSLHIKRVLGLPGERLTFRGGLILVDGQPLPHSFQEGPSPAIRGEFEVPRNHYFLIGDTFDSSESIPLGSIPAHAIVGRARMTTISYRFGEGIYWDRWFQLL